jgi:DNA-binding MarR family transcriptional regulator
VERLVELGLLNRAAVPTNRRQVTVSATRLGIETIEQFHELGARQMRAFLTNVPDAELDLVEHAIEILANAIPSAPTSPDAGPGSQRSDQ